MHSQLKLLLGKQAASGLIALCTRIFGLQPHVQDRKTAAEDYPRAFKLAVTVTIKFLYGLRCLSLEQSCLSWGMRETNTSLAHSFPMFPSCSKLLITVCRCLQGLTQNPLDLIEHCCTFQLFLWLNFTRAAWCTVHEEMSPVHSHWANPSAALGLISVPNSGFRMTSNCVASWSAGRNGGADWRPCLRFRRSRPGIIRMAEGWGGQTSRNVKKGETFAIGVALHQVAG